MAKSTGQLATPKSKLGNIEFVGVQITGSVAMKSQPNTTPKAQVIHYAQATMSFPILQYLLNKCFAPSK